LSRVGACRAAVEALVARHLKRHGGDVEKSLAEVPAGKSTRESLARIGDPDFEGTLSRVACSRSSTDDDDDADMTSSYAVGTATSDGQRFRVLRPHARGGLGAVFVALDSELNREVALKQILDHHADDPTSRQRFLLEAETLPGSALGTPAYMSPEQARGELDRLGPRSDVYSLGSTLYCLLTGRPPLAGDDIGEVLRKVQRGEFVRPRQLDPSLDPSLESVCLKTMAMNPEDRYATCRALADDIERWIADEPVSARREPASARLARWARRHRTAVAAMGLSLATAVILLTVSNVLVRNAQRETARALARVKEEQGRTVTALQLAMAYSLRELGRVDEAERGVAGVRVSIGNRPLPLLELARFDARGAARLALTGGDSDAVRVLEDQAMDDLRRAIKGGFSESLTLRQDRCLDRLRSRDDFRLLLLDLAFPRDPFSRGR